ncbi:hypothetical protein [Kineosporia sp. R_H_3]|uniref:hypothetical protein n=1 Tax=Kineosporia sp. R_H_3 TaxID=1961848 RepID=UPI000B4A7726|nr:hypothetical protein [Kineosporia sp. R_H_3]
MIGLWAGFVAVVVWGVSRLFPSAPDGGPTAALAERFAAGEIDTDTYRSARDELIRTGRG